MQLDVTSRNVEVFLLTNSQGTGYGQPCFDSVSSSESQSDACRQATIACRAAANRQCDVVLVRNPTDQAAIGGVPRPCLSVQIAMRDQPGVIAHGRFERFVIGKPIVHSTLNFAPQVDCTARSVTIAAAAASISDPTRSSGNAYADDALSSASVVSLHRGARTSAEFALSSKAREALHSTRNQIIAAGTSFPVPGSFVRTR